MLHFNELRITQDNKYLIVDVSVDNQDYFQDVLIDSIVIDTQDTFVPDGPSDNPIVSYKAQDFVDLTYSIPEDCDCNPVLVDEDKSYCFTYGTHARKNVRIQVDLSDLKINVCGTMFFVYAIAEGSVTPDTPPEFNKNKIIGTVTNLYPIYKQTLCYLKELNNNCEIPKGFIDMILKLKGIELCIRTGNYIQAIKFWKKFFSNTPCKTPRCGCYG